ncbi:MAG: phosphate acyltransferase PlsX [Planctomycetota bacterium]
MLIAIDAMGGDHAPGEVVRGVGLAIEKGHVRAEELVLVGQEAAIEAVRKSCGCPAIRVVGATQTVDMGEKPAEAFRRKKDSSMMRAVELVKMGQAQAVISLGNTGAFVACAQLLLGLLPGVKRSGIAVTFHTKSGPCTVIDVGANIHCKPQHLFQYGAMASTFAKDVYSIGNPRIGLLNIGEEEGKGNELVKETRELFDGSTLNFLGNIEGQDIFAGRCDVVVCEGFVGNVVLKVAEGIGTFVAETLKSLVGGFVAADKSGSASATTPKLKELFDSFMRRLDYAEYGGAPLLGVNGLVMIGHGRSDARALMNAIRVSRDFVKAGVNDHIRALIKPEAQSVAESESSDAD